MMQSLEVGKFIIFLEAISGKKEVLANLYTNIIKEAKDDYLDVKWLLEMM